MEEKEAEMLGFKSSKALKKSLKKLATTYTFSNLDFDRPNPEHPLAISTAETHTAPQVVVSGMTVRNEKGYAMARATHGFDSGSWYFEVILPDGMRGNVRLGLAQILAEAQAPVGYDEHSCGIRDKDGALMHCGISDVYGDPFGPGSIIGVKLVLPENPSTAQIIDDPTRLSHEQTYPPKRLGTYKVKQDLYAAGQASIEFFINGKGCGSAYPHIYRAKYYPAVSLFGGAEVVFNFGPDFKYDCPPGCLPACEIYMTT